MNNVKSKDARGKNGGRRRRSDSDVDLQALGLRIRQLRGRRTQEEFAEALGVSQAQLSKYELGLSALPLGLLIKLVEMHDKSAGWILTGEN